MIESGTTKSPCCTPSWGPVYLATGAQVDLAALSAMNIRA